VTIPNVEYFFEQAERLIAPVRPGATRQVDLRRAISSVLAAAADEFVGRTKRAALEYGLAYRSIDHRTLRSLCEEIAKPILAARYREYQPEGGFAAELKSFAAIVVELQLSRHQADYDPMIRFDRSDAVAAIGRGRTSLHRFRQSPASHRTRFLALLLFPPR
jgi:hypothetical protein